MALTALDRNSPMPLWAQLEADLKLRLEAGEFSARFPTDLELTETYEVSRHTVREAVRHLNSTGVLKRERGRGTIVNQTAPPQTSSAKTSSAQTSSLQTAGVPTASAQTARTQYSIFQSVESASLEQTNQVLTLQVLTNPEAASHLDLAPDEDLVFLERLRLSAGVPLALDRVWLPHEVAEPLLAVDWSQTGLYSELAKAGAPVPNQGWERLSPVLPTKTERSTLSMSDTDAAFFLERLGCSDERPVEWRATIIRGDQYRLLADWSVTGVSSEERPTAFLRWA